jgi:hypothetical protein
MCSGLLQGMCGFGMLLMQEGREGPSKAVVAGCRFIEQQLLCLARKIGPSAHDGKPERILKMIFIVSCHLIPHQVRSPKFFTPFTP